MGCFCSSMAYSNWHRRVNRKHTDLGNYAKPNILSARNFAIGPFIAEGGMGTVYAGISVKERKFVALKFHGYTQTQPRNNDIDREISLLMAAHGIEGVVQIQGVFMDTASGLVGSPGEKKWLEAYPVIVMEFLDGGSIYDVIHEREKISEADLKRIYAGFIAALASMHTHGYIHNDLKLENIMLESQTDDSGVKIIDLGFMNYLANGASKITHSGVKGTPGYIAPETLSRHEYSYKTDMWQAGCVLYSMLSGVGPFSANDRAQTASGSYFPMTGDCWDAISESAKDLVYKLLVLSPARRLGTQEVLQHPWITGQAPDVHLGDEYVARVKHLALRQKMRKFFLQNDILEKNKIRTDHIQRVLKGARHKCTVSTARRASFTLPQSPMSSPFTTETRKTDASNRRLMGTAVDVSPLHGTPTSERSEDSDSFPRSSSASGDSGGASLQRWTRFSQTTYDNKMTTFRELMISLIKDEEEDYRGVDNGISKPRRGVAYDVFVDVLSDAGLADLACREVFCLFDIGNKGVIDLKDFLLTMLALQSSASSSHAPTDPLSDSSKVHAVPNDAVSLYFSIFDIDDSGFIELSDFKLALACLLDSTTFSHHHITPSSPPSRALHHPLAVLSSRDNNSAYVDDVSGAGDVGAPRTRSARVRCMSFAHAKYLDDGQVEELFHTIDVDATGRISLHEFKKFYDTVIVTSSDSSTIRSGNSLLRPSGFD